ncbi:MAG: DUF1003 domain-containing protein [Actinomycetia bacterium]|nr:DUF1003 domain-containing protein [Actinomycetes bacterium]
MSRWRHWCLWPFRTSPEEEAAIDRLNVWFGSVPGIKQVGLVILVWIALQFVLPARWRWDPYPFIFLMMVITVISLTSNQWLMNASIRANRLTDAERAAILKNSETTLHLAQTMLAVLKRLEAADQAQQALLEDIAEEVGAEPPATKGGT